jgi:hypothetical protein
VEGEEDAELGGVFGEEEAAVFGGGFADGGGVDVFDVLDGFAFGFESHAVPGVALGKAGFGGGGLYLIDGIGGCFFEMLVILEIHLGSSGFIWGYSYPGGGLLAADERG